jgi:hypothetical protein
MGVSMYDNRTRALGMAMIDDRVELHALNRAGEVVLHGWFSPESGINILCHQPRCMIAMDAQFVPSTFAQTLESMGHSTILVAAGDHSDNTVARSAKDLARIAMTAANH